MTNGQKLFNDLMAKDVTYAGYSKDGNLLILSTDMDLVRDTIRAYAKKHKTTATFGYPSESHK